MNIITSMIFVQMAQSVYINIIYYFQTLNIYVNMQHMNILNINWSYTFQMYKYTELKFVKIWTYRYIEYKYVCVC